ncbi:MAG TPA: LysO family transporter [Tissierellaceae bacterium]|nr:LysO family transporter [Tissierellaceae bacterium]
MGLRLLLYLGVLLIGGIIGGRVKIIENIDKNLGKIQNISLLFLLFVMGVSIGINDKIISNLLSIGFKAGIISIFTIIFSIISVYIVKKLANLEVDKVDL